MYCHIHPKSLPFVVRSSILRLKIDIFSVKICIFSLKIDIASVKIQHIYGSCKLYCPNRQKIHPLASLNLYTLRPTSPSQEALQPLAAPVPCKSLAHKD